MARAQTAEKKKHLESKRNFGSGARAAIPGHWRCFSRRDTRIRRRPFDLRELNLVRAVTSSLTTPWPGRWLQQVTSNKRMAKCNAHWRKAPKMRDSFSTLL